MKQNPIETRSFVAQGGQLTSVDTLTGEQKVRLATQIKLGWCGGLFQGRATFSATQDETQSRRASSK